MGPPIGSYGSPTVCRSSYEGDRLDLYAGLIRAELGQDQETWFMIDNTLSAFATVNALDLMERL
jgi:hypothetical protein